MSIYVATTTGHVRVNYLIVAHLQESMYVPELVRKEGLRRGLSPRTIATYRYVLSQFFRKCHKDPLKVTKSDIFAHVDALLEKGASGSTVNVHVNALKFLYTKILHRKLLTNIPFSRTPKRLPTVLTQNETVRLISAIPNPKHRLLVALMYSAGLRVSEVVKLQKKDLDLDQGVGWVRGGKGNKDRLFIIAEKIRQQLRELHGPILFPGRKNPHLSPMTVRLILAKATRTAKIAKHVHPHTLRHSFATHLIENGYGIDAVQSLLGHSSANTTKQYLHVSPRISVVSPLDRLHLL